MKLAYIILFLFNSVNAADLSTHEVTIVKHENDFKANTLPHLWYKAKAKVRAWQEEHSVYIEFTRIPVSPANQPVLGQEVAPQSTNAETSVHDFKLEIRGAQANVELVLADMKTWEDSLIYESSTIEHTPQRWKFLRYQQQRYNEPQFQLYMALLPRLPNKTIEITLITSGDNKELAKRTMADLVNHYGEKQIQCESAEEYKFLARKKKDSPALFGVPMTGDKIAHIIWVQSEFLDLLAAGYEKVMKELTDYRARKLRD